MNLKDIAKIINCDFDGEGFEVTKMNTLKDATKTEISFVANSKYVKDVQESNAGAIIVDKSTKEYVPDGCIALVVDSPYWEMATLSKYFSQPIENNELPEAVIGEGTTVSQKAEIATVQK